MKEETYYYNQHHEADGPANFLTIGKTVTDTPMSFQRPLPQYYSFEFVTQGSGHYTLGECESAFSAGTMVILYKGIPHAFQTDGAHFEKYWCEFDGFLFDSMIDIFLPDKPPVVYCPSAIDEMLQIFTWAEQGLPAKTFSLEAPPMILKILQKLRAARVRRDKCEPQSIKSWIDSNIYRPFALESLSHELFFTPNHIINTFRNAYGVTPYQYYLSERTRLIGDYLRNSDVSIKEIAQIFHIKDAKYLSTFFHHQTGLTPMAYRANYIQNEREKGREGGQ